MFRRFLTIATTSVFLTTVANVNAAQFDVFGPIDAWGEKSVHVSDDGAVMLVVPGNGRDGFLWSASEGIRRTYSDHGPPWPRALSGDGEFVVSSADASYDGSVLAGVRWSQTRSTSEAIRTQVGGATVGLGDLPGGAFQSAAEAISGDGNTVVGFGTAELRQPFRWTADQGMIALGPLPGAPYHFGNATDVSHDGDTIVGNAFSSHGPSEAFRWTQSDGMQGLGDLPGGAFDSVAHAVSADGKTIVGRGTVDGFYSSIAFIWDEVNGMRNLADVLVGKYGFDLKGLRLLRATGVSANGRVIVGTGTDTSVDTFAWRVDLGPIPEPMSLTLSLGALFFFAMADFRRRRKPSTARHR